MTYEQRHKQLMDRVDRNLVINATLRKLKELLKC